MSSIAEVFKLAFNTPDFNINFRLCNGLSTCHKDEEHVTYECRGSDFPLIAFLESNGISFQTHEFESSPPNADVTLPASSSGSRISFPIHTTDRKTLALRLDYLVRKITFKYKGTDFTAYITTWDRKATRYFYFFAFKSEADELGEMLIDPFQDEGTRTLDKPANAHRTEEKQPDRNPGKALLEAIRKYEMALHEEVWSYRGVIWAKDKELYRKVQAARWENLILKNKFEETLRADVDGFFRSRRLYENEWAVPWTRGILLSGRGNGKTQSIFALLKDAQYPALYVKSTAETSLSSVGAVAIENIFLHARNHAPCILVLEDLDEMIKDGAQAAFLQELDENRSGVFIIATTNHPERIEAANLIRPTRFDTRPEYIFEPPEREERIEFLQPKIEKMITGDVTDFPGDVLEGLVNATEGASFARLEHFLLCLRLCIARTLSVQGSFVASKEWLLRNLSKWDLDTQKDGVKPQGKIECPENSDVSQHGGPTEERALIHISPALPMKPFTGKFVPAQEDLKLASVQQVEGDEENDIKHVPLYKPPDEGLRQRLPTRACDKGL